MDRSRSSILDIVRSKDIKSLVWSTMLALLLTCLLKLSCITNTVKNQKFGPSVWLSMNAWMEGPSIKEKIWEKSSKNSRKMDFLTGLMWVRNAEILSSGASSMIPRRDQLVLTYLILLCLTNSHLALLHRIQPEFHSLLFRTWNSGQKWLRRKRLSRESSTSFRCQHLKPWEKKISSSHQQVKIKSGQPSAHINPKSSCYKKDHHLKWRQVSITVPKPETKRSLWSQMEDIQSDRNLNSSKPKIILQSISVLANNRVSMSLAWTQPETKSSRSQLQLTTESAVSTLTTSDTLPTDFDFIS